MRIASKPNFRSKNVFQFISALLLLFIFQSCNKKDELITVDPAFSQYIDGYTSGIISKSASIKIQLASDASTTHALGEVKDKDLFEISPDVKGKAAWLDARTIEFTPAENLKPDQLYKVTFNLGKVTKVPSKFDEFAFNVHTVKPSYSVTDMGLRSSGTKDKMFLPGVIETADFESTESVEKLLTATLDGKKLPIVWQHNGNNRSHNFKVENITRTVTEQPLVLEWNGSPLKTEVKGTKSLAIPAIGDFKVLNVMAVNDAEQYASVQFSDPILVGQPLEGFISISEQPEIAYTINGSEVKVYTGGKLDGSNSITINEGIKNTFGKTLQDGYTANVFFENRMPSVKIIGRGNILPNTGKLVLPFETVNLNAVDISIIKIYENNIPQFLQGNDINGEEDLRRVAKPIVQKTLRLDDDKGVDLQKKQRFSLDIDKFLKTEPGAIYRVTIGFRPQYSLYECQSRDSSGNSDEDEYGGYYNQSGMDEDDMFWSHYDNYYPYGYNWERRDDPCSNSYYNKDRFAARNIIASNIGLTAKRGAGNALTIAVSDLLTTDPMSDVELQVLNYQNQIIATVKSDKDGFARLDAPGKPFLLIAKNKNEKGYLKLDDGSSLPLSRFDTEGEEIKNGIKGFIFGERGVWRPGDSMYINFIIEDKTAKLPKDHPIEFELFTPQGQLFKKLVQTNATDGYNVFKLATLQSSPTGNWLARIKVGGASFEKRIKIETVMPNRLKIDLDFGADPMLGKNVSNTGTLTAAWLFGATAGNLKAKVDASLYAKKASFPKFAGYTFYDPTVEFSSESKTIFDGNLDDMGKAQIKTNFETDETAPGMLSANLLVKVFEPGGAFSISSLTVPYSPFQSYAGIKVPEGPKPWGFLYSGKEHTADIVNVDSKGNLINGSKEMEVEFYKVQWRWWWDNSGGSFSNFTQDKYNKLVKTSRVSLVNGKGKFNFKVGSNDWGRYLILVKDPASGHKTGEVVYLDQPGWETRDNTDDPTAASMLSFNADKEKYNVGDEVTLTIPSSSGGHGLVSIESGSKVLRTFWVQTNSGQTTVKFKVEKEMAPNVYVNVSLIQPHAQTVNDLPIRMYGVIPIFVEDKNTVLHPVITMAASIRPETATNIAVSEQSGKEMSYSIAIVDDGLLGLTNFKTPDPYKYFYAREALGVKSWDLYDYVIGAWGSSLERILTIGGDEGNNGPVQQKKANRFKPVVKYLGPFHLNKGQKTNHSFTLPQYIGSVRAMVVAAYDGSYGNAEKTVQVKKPLMLLGTAPRVMGPGETIKIPASVFTTESSIKNVKVTLSTNSLLTIEGGNTQTVDFSQVGEKMVYFDVKVKSDVGIGKIKLLATSGGEKAEYDVELDIRNPNPAITSIKAETLNKGQNWQVDVSPIGSPSIAKAVLEISSIPSMNLAKRLDFLIQYPHGCIEQITSGAFPQLVLNQLTDLSDAKKAEVDRNVRSVISSLLNFQTKEGGFSYWPGGNEADEWGTNYAGNFLLEAQNNGYAISGQLLQEWKKYQANKAAAWAPSTTNFYGSDLTQAYRLYLLALAKSPDMGSMNRLKEFAYLSPTAKWRLAGAYQLAGQNQVALGLISGLPVSIETDQKRNFTYGSDLRDEAMILEVLTLMGKRQLAAQLVNKIAAKLSQDQWYSTQTTAYSLISIAKYCGKNPSSEKIVASVTINGKSVSMNSKSYVSQIPVDVSKGNSKIVLNNKGNNVLYARVISEGQPLAGENLQVNNDASILNMEVSYLSRTFNPINIDSLTQGTDFIAKVTITNPGNHGYYERMALTQIFPGGWEILNTRMQDGEGSFRSSPMEYQDVRDDRVYTYFGLPENKTYTYYIQLNATYLGRYFLPGVFCTAMYDNNITAGTNGRWIEVRPGRKE